MEAKIENLVDDEIIDSDVAFENIEPNINKIPWVEKYRPQKIDDVMYQDEVKIMLKKTFDTGNLPHLIFYGPPGTGKTSTILAIAKELYGPENYRDRVLELNASDERGINVVRGKIAMLAKTAINSINDNNILKSPNFRIIILDEADAMTTEAQSALRKTIEDNSEITRFCFICNYINQIIEPIMSRCVKFRFKPIPKKSMYDKMKYIADNEGIKISDKCLDKIITISDGDFRSAITMLQNTTYIKQEITLESICEIANIFPDSYFKKIDEICVKSKNNKLCDVIELAKDIKKSGFPIQKIIRYIHNMIIDNNNISDDKKAIISLSIADSERKLINGTDEYIQILHILSHIKGVMCNMIVEPLHVYLI